MGIWEAAEALNEVIDDSDPDIDLPQIAHLLQTSEAIRKAFPEEEHDWFHLTGFIHDLGKVLTHPRFFNQPQWAVVGDTFPVGCAFSSDIIYSEYFQQNPDSKNPEYRTSNGIYAPECGLDNLMMAWGHDEYMYRVCVENKCTLPPAALYVIRFHSFYAYHQQGAYRHFMSEKDEKMFTWLKEFQKCDLYSKCETPPDVAALKPYYQKLIAKYFPPKLRW